MTPAFTGRVGHTGDQNGPWTPALFWTFVFTGREHGPWTGVVCTELWSVRWCWWCHACTQSVATHALLQLRCWAL